MSGSVTAFVAGVDRLLTRGRELFPGAGDGVVLDAGGGVVPAAPVGGGLGAGVDVAGGVYERSRAGAVGLDAESGVLVGKGDAVGQQGRMGAGVVRDQARDQAAVIAPMTNSAAGVRLLVSTMDDRLAAMQQQLDTAGAENRLLALRLRQLVQAYQGLGSSGTGVGMSLPGLGGCPIGGGCGGSGLGGLSMLGALPATLMSRVAPSGGGVGMFPASSVDQPARGAAGIAQGAIPMSEVSFDGKEVWSGGRGAVSRYLEEALDRMGITDQRARANWISGMTTIAEHESEFRADAINLTDSNAHGQRQSDGGPLNSSRGIWQLVPGTFARFHQPGTSNHIWDPVANACASMNYQMSRYGVDHDGHNQRALVGQANPGIHRGY